MDRYIHVASRVSVIYSIMVKMAATVTEHCSKAPRTRCNGKKTNGMKTFTNVLQIIIKGGNSIFR